MDETIARLMEQEENSLRASSSRASTRSTRSSTNTVSRKTLNGPVLMLFSPGVSDARLIIVKHGFILSSTCI